MNNIFLTCVNSEKYIIGLIVLSRSLFETTKQNLYVLCTTEIFEKYNELFIMENIVPIVEEDIVLSDSVSSSFENSTMKYWLKTLFKIRMFNLTSFNKICFLDSDMLIVGDLSNVFSFSHCSAVDDGDVMLLSIKKGLNSGFLVFEPSNKLYNDVLNNILLTHQTKGIFGDQDVIQMTLKNWVSEENLHLSTVYNSCAYYLDRYVDKDFKIIHFFGSSKPWSWNMLYYYVRLFSYLIRGRTKTFIFLRKYYKNILLVRKKYNL